MTWATAAGGVFRGPRVFDDRTVFQEKEPGHNRALNVHTSSLAVTEMTPAFMSRVTAHEPRSKPSN